MLKELTSEEELILELSPDYRRANGKCPVCRGNQFRNETECSVDEYEIHDNWRKFRLYCLANVPHEFQVLDLADLPYEDVRDELLKYVDQFETMRWYGLGYEIYGKDRGVGKTYAAAGVLKALVLKGYSGWFMQFNDAKNLYQASNPIKDAYTRRLRESEILVLDEILEPHHSYAQQRFYEEQLEDIIRYRTSNNFPTITTTNLNEASMEQYYPRVFSLLSGKQTRYTLSGKDYRDQAYTAAYAKAHAGHPLAIC